MRHLLAGSVCALLISCATNPHVVVNSKVPSGSTIAVISFRDCLCPLQNSHSDCVGSGNAAGQVYARALGAKDTLKITAVPRPVSATEELSDDAAVKLGRQQHADFVLNAEVNDYYRPGPMTFSGDQQEFRSTSAEDRVTTRVRLIRVSDGSVVAVQSETVQARYFQAPEDVLRQIAARLRDAI